MAIVMIDLFLVAARGFCDFFLTCTTNVARKVNVDLSRRNDACEISRKIILKTACCRRKKVMLCNASEGMAIIVRERSFVTSVKVCT